MNMKPQLNVYKSVDYINTELYKPTTWVINLKRFINGICWGHQRATRGYSDHDLWNTDFYLLGLMINTIKAYKDLGYGYSIIATDEELKNEDYSKNPDKYNHRWDEYLDDLIKSLEHAYKTEDEKDVAKAFNLLKQHFFGLWY